MTKKIKLSPGDANQIRVYMKRARELWSVAESCKESEKYDACAINVIHSCISLADAVCILKTGYRYAGTTHNEAVQYFFDLKIDDDDFQRACRRLGQIISGKTTAEYGGKNLTKKECEDIFLNGSRFKDYALSKILVGY